MQSWRTRKAIEIDSKEDWHGFSSSIGGLNHGHPFTVETDGKSSKRQLVGKWSGSLHLCTAIVYTARKLKLTPVMKSFLEASGHLR